MLHDWCLLITSVLKNALDLSDCQLGCSVHSIHYFKTEERCLRRDIAGVSGALDSYCSLKPLCSGMGKVVPARTSPTLLPPSPRTVLSLSCFIHLIHVKNSLFLHHGTYASIQLCRTEIHTHHDDLHNIYCCIICIRLTLVLIT